MAQVIGGMSVYLSTFVGSSQTKQSNRPARGRFLGVACLLALLAVLAAAPARADTLGFVEFHRDAVNGVDGLNGVESVAISPDGAHIYAGGSVDDALAVFSRDVSTGALTFVEIQRNGVGGVSGLNKVRAVAVSPDGGHVYAAGYTDDAVAVFSRDASTGALTFVEVHENGVGGITSLDGAHGVTVSPDGDHVYVASGRGDSVTVFSRDEGTGMLTLIEAHVDGAGGITSLAGAETVATSPDGDHLYVAAQSDGAVTVFSRDSASGQLTLLEVQKDGVGGVDGLNWVQGVALSQDGAHVYTASGVDNSVAVFSRDATTGLLTFVEFHQDGINGVDGLTGAEWVAVSPNGAYVYAVSDVENTLVVFARNETTGALTLTEIHKDAVGGVDGLDGAASAVVSPDNGHVYVVGKVDDSVAVFGSLCGNGIFDSGEECDDGNTVDGDCCSSICKNEPAGSACADDGNVCTDDKCNGVGLCLHVNNTVPCDDGEFCTVNDTCSARVCVGEARDCSAAGDQCNDGVCDDIADECVPQPKTDGVACDDGDACTQTDTCQAGVCVGADPVICTALDQCHVAGECDPTTGVCSDPATTDGAPCDDGNACTQADTCQAGVCVGADPVICTALDQCHVAGECNPQTGVCTDPAKEDGAACDDGNACTQSDACFVGVCVGSDPVVCTALDQCHVAGECDPDTGVCSDPAKEDGTACDDDSACTRSDACFVGVCVGSDPVVCTALDQCHAVGECDPATGVCSDPAKVDGTPCDDADGCTQTDTCEAGVCVGTNPVICTPLDQCHVAGECDSATGLCSNPEEADGTACDDGDACTQTDTCEAGVCVGADPVVCTAADQCHVAGECDPATGVCSDPAETDGTPCDDGDACTQSDSCIAGVCVGADPVICTALDQCHVAGECDPGTGLCSDPLKEDGAACDDGDACTQSDTCIAGVCVGADPVVCTALDQCHVAGECDPETGVCSDPAKPDATPCDDENACTRSDACLVGVCVGSDPVICSALDQCHVAGECNPATGVCSDPAIEDGTPCDDGNACTQSDSCIVGFCIGAAPVICTALDQCHVAGECDPATGVCSDPAIEDGTACDDGDACTQSDSCIAGVCVGADPVICAALDQCHVAGECDPATGVCSDPAIEDGTACDDGDACTQTDECFGGVCVGANPVICTALDQCHVAGECDPATGVCSDPAIEDGTACDDGDACTQSDSCIAGICVGADPVICTALDQCHVAGECDPATGSCSDPAIADGTACDDGDACTQTDECFVGVCVGMDPVICAAFDQCHVAGECDPATGVCSNPERPDEASASFEAEADAYTDESTPTTNFGTAPQLRLDGRPDRFVFLRFNVTGIDGLSVQSAVVRLRTTSASNSGSDVGGEIHSVSDNTWDEFTLTHDNSPAIDGPQLSSVGWIDPSQDVEFDVTAAIAGDGIYSFGLVAGSNNMAVYASREAEIGRPELIIVTDTPCDDGDACTQSDSCVAGVCVGTDPVICTALDQCHVAGECDPATGICSDPAADDATPCDDGDACTQTDGCIAGVCVGADPVICTALDQCHVAGECDPATGVCSDPNKTDGAACDDDDACTQTDGCVAGVCVGTNPVICTALDQCHVAGECDSATGICSDPAAVNATPCDDGDACTQTDGCVAGVCVGTNPVICTALDQCHVAGECDPATGICSDPDKTDGAACDDGDACTQTDACVAGDCVGTDPVICAAQDQCHVAGECDPATGVCSDPAKADATPCDDGDACTQTDTCVAGTCVGSNPVVCTALDQCHVAGECNPATGICSNPNKTDGAACDDANICTEDDLCFAGECIGEPAPDLDADGFCDAIDSCPSISDPAQLDEDGDGVGDLCQCTAAAPGRCIAGGGSQRTDCFLEVNTVGPVTLNSRGTKVKSVLQCTDGDLACDLDGARNGQCTFGVALCFGNSDPRYPNCDPATIKSTEILRPRAHKSASLGGQTNAGQLEQALGALGLEVRRRGRVVAAPIQPVGNNRCSQLVRLVTPAPKVIGGKARRLKFKLRAQATNKRRDTDSFVLVCR